MAQEYTGKCFCGETEFSAKAEPNHILCHCNTCKFLSGSAFTLNQIVPKADFKITKGSTKTFTYHGDSGKPVHCYYCPNCTTHVAHEQTALGDKMIVRTVLLKGGADFNAAAEIYGKDKLKWLPKVAETFDTTPPS